MVTDNGLLVVSNIIFSRIVLKRKALRYCSIIVLQINIAFSLIFFCMGEYPGYRGIECRGIFSLKFKLLPQLQTTHLTHFLIFVHITLKIKKNFVPGKTSRASMEKANFTNFKIS